MTATEWLIEQLIKYELVPSGTNPDNVLFNKAKEMEQQQLEKAYQKGWDDATSQGIKEAHKYQ